ncbi:MAG: hypothetical protein R3303_01540 [Marinobacter sp.]|nr:hypothetical protein [Marinobacter sp.]
MKSDVLPQSDAQRNGEISLLTALRPGCRRLPGYACLLILLMSGITDGAAAGGIPDWSYHPESRGRPDADAATAAVSTLTTSPCEPSPVVLPTAHWPESGDADPRGWHLKQPSIGTGRVEAYTDSRTAVRLAEQRQDSALAGSAAPLPGFDELPGALQGLNYRIDFGVEYRF